uniref:Uncharacterized protein n=1 Tax=Solanum lycopersicum TaxID=4081 RepID=A0A3Q7FAV4_SOLLC
MRTGPRTNFSAIANIAFLVPHAIILSWDAMKTPVELMQYEWLAIFHFWGYLSKLPVCFIQMSWNSNWRALNRFCYMDAIQIDILRLGTIILLSESRRRLYQTKLCSAISCASSSAAASPKMALISGIPKIKRLLPDITWKDNKGIENFATNLLIPEHCSEVSQYESKFPKAAYYPSAARLQQRGSHL